MNQPAPQEPVVQQPAPVAPPAAPPANQPVPENNWRDRVAGGDTDLRKALDRFNSEDQVGKSWLEMRKKMDSGEYKRNVPFNPEWKDEEKAAWRKENGIPDAPDKYKLPEGLVLSDADKPVVDSYLKFAQENNIPDGIPDKNIDWYFKFQAEQAAAAAAEDKQFQQKSEETLREKWGPEYLANRNMTESFLKTRVPEAVADAILAAGPETVEAFANIAREISPAMTIMPNSSDPNKAVGDRLSFLKGQMGTEEWKVNKDWQQEYVRLIDAQNAVAKRK